MTARSCARSRDLPQFDATENAGRVVDDRDAFQSVAQRIAVHPARVSAPDVEVVVEEQRIDSGNGFLNPMVPALVALVLAGQLTQIVVVRLVLAEWMVTQLEVGHE